MKLSAADIRDRLLPITLSQAVGFLCGLAGVKLTTKLVSPADYGAYGVFLTFTPLGMWVVHAGLVKFTARHWAASPDRGSLLREVLRAGVRKLPWLVAATLAATLAMNAAGFLRLWPALFVSAALLSAASLAQTALQAERSHWTDLAVSSAGSLSRSFVPPVLYLLAGGSLIALEAGFCLHTIVFSCGCLYLLHKYHSPGPAGAAQLTPVYEGPLFILLSLAGWLMTAVNRWIVAAFFGVEKAGYFTLASNVAMIVTTMLGVVIMQYFQPGLFAAAGEAPAQRRQLARRIDLIAAAYAGLSLAGLAALRLCAPWLIGPLISGARHDSRRRLFQRGPDHRAVFPHAAAGRPPREILRPRRFGHRAGAGGGRACRRRCRRTLVPALADCHAAGPVDREPAARPALLFQAGRSCNARTGPVRNIRSTSRCSRAGRPRRAAINSRIAHIADLKVRSSANDRRAWKAASTENPSARHKADVRRQLSAAVGASAAQSADANSSERPARRRAVITWIVARLCSIEVLRCWVVCAS